MALSFFFAISQQALTICFLKEKDQLACLGFVILHGRVGLFKPLPRAALGNSFQGGLILTFTESHRRPWRFQK